MISTEEAKMVSYNRNDNGDMLNRKDDTNISSNGNNGNKNSGYIKNVGNIFIMPPPALPLLNSPPTSYSVMSSPYLKIILLVVMVLQNSATVLVGRYTRSRPGVTKEDMYVVNHLILVTEAAKFILASLLEHYYTSRNLPRSIKENVLDRPLDALKIIVPSLLYLVQNNLLYIGLSNLSAPLFQVAYQSKLLTTALVSVVMLGRRYSLKQWFCLALLGIGVAVVVLGEAGDTKKEAQEDEAADGETTAWQEKAENQPPVQSQSLTTGLLAVSVACLSSALAGVYFEKVLKKPTETKTLEGGSPPAKHPPVSLWMRNVQMAFFSVVIALIQYRNLDGSDASKPFLHGFTPWVWVLVSLQAGGGLLVAAVIKYADNVLKGLATGVSVVFASLVSTMFMGTALSGQFVMGATVILGSVFFFSNGMPGGGGGNRRMEG